MVPNPGNRLVLNRGNPARNLQLRLRPSDQLLIRWSPTRRPTHRPLREWRLSLSLAATLVALQASGWRRALEYRRAAVLHGQLWRLLTGSLVHLGWAHLLRDVTGLLLLWLLFGLVSDN